MTAFAEVIVAGRVRAITSDWDPSVNALYTHVVIETQDVFKGSIEGTRVTLKQLGGSKGDIGLRVVDQATFATGERVLVFLERRPRDGSFYTAALSQGKWLVTEDAAGLRTARRGDESIALGPPRGAIASSPASEDTPPREASFSAPFMLMATPFLYPFFPPIDVQAGGQPGLPDGGVAAVRESAARWSDAGSSFRFLTGSAAGPARCSGEFLGSYHVTLSYMDPCGEISNTGATLAIAGSYFTSAASVMSNGRTYRLALEGFVVHNDSAVALTFLQSSGCFEDIELHELGHVLGLGHSADSSSIMFPSINSGCHTTPRRLGVDDVAGIRSIYPAAPDGVPGQATVLAVTAAAETLTVEWSLGPGAAVTTHRLDFSSGGQTIASVIVGAATRVTLPIATGTAGVFALRITAFNEATAAEASAPFVFSIGAACTAPPAAPVPSGHVVLGTATVSWPAVPGATHYLVQAGTAVGTEDLFPVTNVGGSTRASATGLPAGFSAWVRVRALNACGVSPPADVFVH